MHGLTSLAGRAVALALPAVLALACSPDAVQEGPLTAGTAEVRLDIPVGTPLAGYTARLLGISRPDRRTSPFAPEFAPTGGVHTPPTAKAIWLHNDDHHLVLVKIDVCYLADHVVEDVEAALSEHLDQDLRGQVMIAASHTHQGWGGWDAHLTYFLGGDQHHPELDARLVDSITNAAVQAWERREDAAIGMGWAIDWDPDDLVYRDRRGENDDLAMWGEPGERTGKDPFLHVTRIDRADGSPLAMTVTFGIHGIAVGEDSPMASTEASGQVERALEAQFDEPVMVMHLQGSGGDASPAGSGARFERLEDVGRHAVGPILELYEGIQTSQTALSIETSTGREPQNLDQISVRREDGTTFTYAPDARPDGVVYDEDGALISPLEEFNARNGAAFCGTESPPLPLPIMNANTFPYTSCVLGDGMVDFIAGTFEAAEGVATSPIPSSTTARTAAVRLGPLPVRDVDGTVHTEAISAGFFPGEPTAIYGEQFRRRAAATWGDRRAWMVGYAQDHEGYLLVPEDWMLGGYEPNINQWGPLQGEYLMDRVLARGEVELGDGTHQRWEPDAPAPIALDRRRAVAGVPEQSPEAGTRLDALSEDDVALWTPDDLPVQLTPVAQVPRVQGMVQLAWIGGDPRADQPVVSLERQDGAAWVPATTRAGRPVTDLLGDILVTWTPDPLKQEDAEDGSRTHRWWAVWQAVSHWHDPAGLPEGTYRLAARGTHFTGTEQAWPWTTSDYEVLGEPFEVVPAELTVVEVEGGVEVWLAGPEHGFRQIAQGGAAAGPNPVPELVDIEVDQAGVDVTPQRRGARTFLELDLSEADSVRVVDVYGNEGTWRR